MRERLFPGDRLAAYVVLVALGLVTVLPLLYMIVLALQSDAEVQSGDPVLWPADPAVEQLHPVVRGGAVRAVLREQSS